MNDVLGIAHLRIAPWWEFLSWAIISASFRIAQCLPQFSLEYVNFEEHTIIIKQIIFFFHKLGPRPVTTISRKFPKGGAQPLSVSSLSQNAIMFLQKHLTKYYWKQNLLRRTFFDAIWASFFERLAQLIWLCKSFCLTPRMNILSTIESF